MEPNKNKLNLTKKQKAVIPVILSSRTITEGVEKAGIAKPIFYAWLKNPEFKAEYEKQQDDVLVTGLSELKTAFGEAACELRKLLKSENEKIRLSACAEVIGYVQKFIQYDELEKRIDALENRNTRS